MWGKQPTFTHGGRGLGRRSWELTEMATNGSETVEKPRWKIISRRLQPGGAAASGPGAGGLSSVPRAWPGQKAREVDVYKITGGVERTGPGGSLTPAQTPLSPKGEALKRCH